MINLFRTVWIWFMLICISSSSGARSGLGAKPRPPAECRLYPHLETYWSRTRVSVYQTVSNFDRSAVKICKRCLQTASALQGLARRPHWGTFVPWPLGYRPPNENFWRRHWSVQFSFFRIIITKYNKCQDYVDVCCCASRIFLFTVCLSPITLRNNQPYETHHV